MRKELLLSLATLICPVRYENDSAWVEALILDFALAIPALES